ncbi:MAG TPA: LapA family protein [Candidatus Paceibacterota bacterium]|nr:LapA family protein [Candidatus Paceibacterota bacterium]
MILAILLGILFGSALTVFAIENASVVSVSMLSWHFTAPVAFLLVGAAGIAAIITLVGTLPKLIRDERRIRVLQAQKREVENELSKYRIVIPVAPPSQGAAPIHVIEREKVYAQ